MKKNDKTSTPLADEAIEKRKRLLKTSEIAANIGLVLVAVGLVSPIVGFENEVWIQVFKWIFTVGAGVYAAARIAGSLAKGESFRVRRIRRLEVWAGISFCIAAFFWFWNTRQADPDLIPYMSFKMFQETIVFTLVGAMIQIIASWMLSSALRKEQNNNS